MHAAIPQEIRLLAQDLDLPELLNMTEEFKPPSDYYNTPLKTSLAMIAPYFSGAAGGCMVYEELFRGFSFKTRVTPHAPEVFKTSDT